MIQGIYTFIDENLDNYNTLYFIPVPHGTTDAYLRAMPNIRITCNMLSDDGKIECESIDLSIDSNKAIKLGYKYNIIKLIGNILILHEYKP